ncbi:AzlC family ABC transporter permease [Populibacterium corticicola]|uniref:AzlC family ABC transporter permease n=1 Tax=Populibacterium corticicola TaxID=1812826 RepID=A0ABW5XD96_9MICO
MRDRFTPAVVTSLSLSFATGLYGISFGALAVASGLNTWQAMVLSLVMFSGGSQFAFIGVIATGGTGAAATAAASLLFVRNGIYGAQMNALIGPGGVRKYVAAQVTIDESAGMASLQSDPAEQRRAFWVTGLAILLLWNLFTFVGTQLGATLDPAAWGLDGAAVAAFAALLWPRLKTRDHAAIAVLGALVTVLLIPIVPAGVPIIIAAGVSAVAGWRLASRHLSGRASKPEEGTES